MALVVADDRLASAIASSDFGFTCVADVKVIDAQPDEPLSLGLNCSGGWPAAVLGRVKDGKVIASGGSEKGVGSVYMSKSKRKSQISTHY